MDIYVQTQGQLPFEGSSLAEVLRSVKAGRVEFPEEYWKSVSMEAKRLVRRLLNYDPQQRYTAKKALADPWFALAEQRIETPIGNDVSVLASDLERERRSSVFVEDIEDLLKNALLTGANGKDGDGDDKADHAHRLFGLDKIYRKQSTPQRHNIPIT